MNAREPLQHLLAGTVALVLAHGAPAPASDSVPLGHPDFYPSPERPVGWRGDGNGCWPGATPVTEWDGTTGRNIAWKTPMPDISWAQPVVVGDRVFVLADWYRLFCLSAIDGRVLWERDCSVASLLPPAKAERYRRDLAAFEELVARGADWRRRMGACLARAKDKGIDIRLEVRFGGIKPLDKLADQMRQLEQHPDLKHEFESLHAEGVANEFSAGEWCLFGVLDGRNTRVSGRGSRPESRLRELQKFLYDECDWFHCDWGIWVTYTFATPVSDGEHVYVPFSNRTLWCFDMEGNRRWVTWEHEPMDYQGGFEPLYTRFSQSLVLHEGRVYWACEGRLRAYEAATGRRLWEVLEEGWKGPRTRPNREAETPGIVRVPGPDGKPLTVLSDGHRLLEAATGKVLCEGLTGESYNHSVVSSADLVLTCNGGDNRPNDGRVWRLSLGPGGTVAKELVWERKAKNWLSSSATPVVHDGLAYSGPQVVDLATGKILAEGLRMSNNSPAMGGNGVLVCFRNLGANAYGAGRDSPQLGRQIGSGRLPHRYEVDPDYRKFWDSKYRFAAGADHYGERTDMCHSSPCLAGNRIFFRSPGYVWCIGDPRAPYAWNPRSRPAAAAPSRARTGKGAPRSAAADGGRALPSARGPSAPPVDRKALLGRLMASVEAGKKPTFYMGSMRTKMTVVEAKPDGSLRLSARGMTIACDLARLSEDGLRSLERALAR